MTSCAPSAVALDMPLPAHDPNPVWKDADTAMWEWIDSHGICPEAAERQRMRAAESVLCIALYYPAADTATFEGLCRWLGWAFVADDVIDNPPASTDPCAATAAIAPMAAVLDGEGAASPLAAALADMRSQVMTGRSAAWRSDFTEATRRWLWAAYSHAVQHASGQYFSLAEYRASMHRYASGYPMTLALCEYATGTDLPETVRNLPAFTVMRRAAADHLGLVNDLYSAHIEDPDERYHNTVFVMARQRRLSVADTAARVTGIANGHLATYQAARRDLVAQLEAAVSGAPRTAALTVADAYGTLIRGNFDYHAHAERYHS